MPAEPVVDFVGDVGGRSGSHAHRARPRSGGGCFAAVVVTIDVEVDDQVLGPD